MPDALIENPILNSPYFEPERHFKFSDEGITNEVVEGIAVLDDGRGLLDPLNLIIEVTGETKQEVVESLQPSDNPNTCIQ
jgi:hypothetical protein